MRNKEYKAGNQGEEIRKYFDANGIKYKDAAEAIGVQPASLSNILAGRDSIGKKRAKKLAEVYGFDLTYLLTGEGELFPRTQIRQTIGKVGEGGTAINEVNTGSGQSVAELLRRIAELEKASAEKDELIAKKEEEVKWLRSLVNQLLGQNSGKNLQMASKDQTDKL